MRRFVGEIDGENTQSRDQTVVGIDRIEKFVHVIVLLDRRNVKSFSLVAAENLQLHHLIETVQVQSGGERRQGFNAPVIGGENDVLNLQARRRRGTVRVDVDHDDAPALRQMQALRQSRG